MKLGELHDAFLLQTVVAGYRYEAHEVRTLGPLLTAEELMDFYMAYCAGGPL